MKKLLAVVLLAISTVALADIKIIVPFAAGGSFDIVARQYSKFLEQEKIESAVENVVGAGSLIGTRRLQGSLPNTLMITSSSFYVNIAKGEFKLEEFTPVSIIASSPLFLVTNKSKKLSCEHLRDSKTKYFIGNAGKDSITSIPSAFVAELHPHITEIPYKGIAQASTDLLGNHISGTFISSLSSNRPEFDVLANTTASRFEGIPSLKECLGVDKVVQTQWLMLASPGSDTKFLERMNNLAIKFANSAESQTFFKEQGMVSRAAPLDATRNSVKNENENWKKLLK